MKRIFLLIPLVLVTLTSLSQGKSSIAAEFAVPTGEYGKEAGVGVGASLGFEGKISGNLLWTASAGYLNFAKKRHHLTDIPVESHATEIPIEAGGKYFFGKHHNGFFGGAQIGMHYVTITSTSLGKSHSIHEAEFSYSPILGYHYKHIEVMACYEFLRHSEYAGFRVAYLFGKVH